MMNQQPASAAVVVAVCRSPGGIPKLPVPDVQITESGLQGDGHNHSKHVQPDRAVCLWDMETIRDLIEEGFPLRPGAAGENLTLEGLHVQRLDSGTLLEVGEVVLKLTQPRKPCYVLDEIDVRLKDVVIGRLGFMAAVVCGGTVAPGMSVRVLPATRSDEVD